MPRQRRTVKSPEPAGGTEMECSFSDCRDRLTPGNAATNFPNPSLSVRRAVEGRIVGRGSTILEVGSGNLRNARYIRARLDGTRYDVFELEEVQERFKEQYESFRNGGGRVLTADLGRRHYDFVICTFVLETVCPAVRRDELLAQIRSRLRPGGALIASIRGVPGVRGARYTKCPAGEGFVTPLRTFVRPYSIREARRLLTAGGFEEVKALQRYRVEAPENIHLLAS